MEAAQKLLDFSQPQLDVGLLDSVVEAMYSGSGEAQKAAQSILNQLKEHPEAWTRVDAILEFSQSPRTKYYALQILEGLVGSRWRALPREQCEGIKQYVVGLAIKISSDAEAMEREKMYISKLNLVLVCIVKQEWPKNWPSFIGDIVGASRTSESLCLNNMRILKLLSEEVFDFSSGVMTAAKAHHLKQQFCSEFQAVYELCTSVLEKSANAGLIQATLETLLKFLNWIPLGYIFETDLVESLCSKFLDVPLFRNVTLQCLTEMAAVAIPAESQSNYEGKARLLFVLTLEKLSAMVPVETDIREAYAGGKDTEQKFIANLALFLSTFLKNHAALVEVEKAETEEARVLFALHDRSLRYLLSISEVQEVEVFKICLDYWNWLAAELYRECPFIQHHGGFSYLWSGTGPKGAMDPSFPGARGLDSPDLRPRQMLYAPHMSRLREIMIGRMTKPEEVLVVENEVGEIVREAVKDTDSIALYKTMRETLVYLTHLDYADTERIMTARLSLQVNGKEWSWKNLNTLCWAIGSISGAMLEEDEKRFLVTVIRDLLGLCEAKRGKDNKAVIASNIMYVVGQYPRFLRAHWKFLKTVVNKLFEFMHETHEGVQDMACDTFIKIAQKCRRHFVLLQLSESQPFICEILENISTIICDLSSPQVHVFYEALGYIISSEHDSLKRDSLVERLMGLPNSVWDEVMSHAAQNVEVLKDPEVVKNLANILKTNVAACKSIGNPFVVQLGKIYLDALNIYKVTSENISSAVAANGEAVLKQPLIKGMRAVKTEILKLISSWVGKAEDGRVVVENFVPPLLDAVLLDYQRNVPGAREPEVLACITAFVLRLEVEMVPQIPAVLDAVFQCSLDMIAADLHSFPEHRLNFFLLLQAINDHAFPAFVAIPPAQFKLVLDAIIWAFKHSMRNVAEIGLEILHKLLQNIANETESSVAAAFYREYLLELLQHILGVVTDSSQAAVAGLTYYANILVIIFAAVETGRVAISLDPANPNAGPAGNMEFVGEYVGRLLKTAFPHLSGDQIRVTVKGFFSFDRDPGKFKEHLRDFLVQLKEDNGEDASGLFLEEREKEIQDAQAAKAKADSAVPGILNPYSEVGGSSIDQSDSPSKATIMA